MPGKPNGKWESFALGENVSGTTLLASQKDLEEPQGRLSPAPVGVIHNTRGKTYITASSLVSEMSVLSSQFGFSFSAVPNRSMLS